MKRIFKARDYPNRRAMLDTVRQRDGFTMLTL